MVGWAGSRDDMLLGAGEREVDLKQPPLTNMDYQRCFRGAPVAMAVANCDGLLLECNWRFMELSGLGEAHLAQRSMFALVRSEALRKAYSWVALALHNGPRARSLAHNPQQQQQQTASPSSRGLGHHAKHPPQPHGAGSPLQPLSAKGQQAPQAHLGGMAADAAAQHASPAPKPKLMHMQPRRDAAFVDHAAVADPSKKVLISIAVVRDAKDQPIHFHLTLREVKKGDAGNPGEALLVGS